MRDDSQQVLVRGPGANAGHLRLRRAAGAVQVGGARVC
jgi:hypothetical protein